MKTLLRMTKMVMPFCIVVQFAIRVKDVWN